MMASSNCWQAPVSYVIFSEERPKRVACARFHFSRITYICWFVRFNSSVRTASWLRNSFSCSMLSSKSCRISFLFSFVSCSFDNASALRTISLLRFYGSGITEEAKISFGSAVTDLCTGNCFGCVTSTKPLSTSRASFTLRSQ